MRREGIALSWVGSGRLIFSLNYGEHVFEELSRRLILATQKMMSDGWFWKAEAQTNKSIRRGIFKELLRARFAS